MLVKFIPDVFGDMAGVTPSVGELKDISIFALETKGYEISCSLGECGMTYSTNAADDEMTFALTFEQGTGKLGDLDNVSISTSRGVSVTFTCSYSTEVEVSSDSFAVKEVKTSGTVDGRGSLAQGFALDLQVRNDLGGIVILGNIMAWVRSVWSRLT